jgi:hypothetical protein
MKPSFEPFPNGKTSVFIVGVILIGHSLDQWGDVLRQAAAEGTKFYVLV